MSGFPLPSNRNPEDIIQAATLVSHLQTLRNRALVSSEEFDGERKAIEGYLKNGTLPTSPLKAEANARATQAAAAKQADAVFDGYKFRDGESLDHLKIHYATLGTPHRNAAGDIDNAVLVLHWTGADSRVLLSPTFMKALFDHGRPLDAGRYYLIFPDNVGHGQSSKPSDGLKAKFPNYDYGDIVDLQHKLVTEMRSTNLQSDGKTCLRPARRHGDRRLSRQIHDVGEGCPALWRDILPLDRRRSCDPEIKCWYSDGGS